MNSLTILDSLECIPINENNMLIDYHASGILQFFSFKTSKEWLAKIYHVKHGHYVGAFEFRISLTGGFQCQAAYIPLNQLFSAIDIENEERDSNLSYTHPNTIPETIRLSMGFYKFDFTLDFAENFDKIIRNVLLQDLEIIIRNDFPRLWDILPIEIMKYLICDNQIFWIIGYLCLFKLIKCYDSKKSYQRHNLNKSMPEFLNIMKWHMEVLNNDQSVRSVTIQNHIMKMYYTYNHLHLSMDVISIEMCIFWMDVLCAVSTRPVPLEINNVDPEIRQSLIWWRCKKWASRAISKCLERYFNPCLVIDMYKEVGVWFLNLITRKIVKTLLIIYEQYSRGTYITSRILTSVMEYFEYLVRHSHSWNYLKPHISYLVKEVLFRMLCHTEMEKLWNENPVEFIRSFFDILSDPTPAYTAGNLLNELCLKRKGTLEVVIEFVNQILDSKTATSIHKDAAFHIIGKVAYVLMKRKNLTCQVEMFIVNYVIPILQAPEGFRRSRAFWLISQLGGVEFKDKYMLKSLVKQTINSIFNDPDLPVQIMACIGVSRLLVKQKDYVKPVIDNHLHQIVLHILNLLRKTQVDQLNDVLQSIIRVFPYKMIPIAINTVLHLKETLFSLLEVGKFDDYKELIIAGILSTIDIVCTSKEDHEDIAMQLEPIISSIIEMLISKNAYYLLSSLTCRKISPAMWQVLAFLKTIIENKCDEIVRMMPLLTNYTNSDKPSLVADQSRINTLFDICSIVLHSTDIDESFESNAAKLLEMILINYRGHVDNYIPRFIELVLVRLSRYVKCPELRTMCIQVVIASLHSNKELTLTILNNNWPGTNVLIFDEFLNIWYDNMDCFLGIHDRKLCIIGLGILISLNSEQRSQSLQRLGDKIMPLLIKMMDSLKNMYINNKEDDSEEVEDDDDYGNIHVFTSELEKFPTDLDNKDFKMLEFINIDNIMLQLSKLDPDWYHLLVSTMTEDHYGMIISIMNMAKNNIKEKQIFH